MATRKDGIGAALEKAHAALQPRQPPPVPIDVREERAAAELAAVARRMTQSDLAAINSMYARHGWPGVRAGLEQAGLSADALEVATSVVQSGGLPALGQAVAQRVQAEDLANLQAEAEPVAAELLSKLSPADLNEAARILATGGPAALAAKAAELGVHPAVATIAVHTIATHGPDGARQAAVHHVQAEARRSEVYAAAERDLEAAQKEEWSPYAHAEIHQAALDFYARHAPALEAAGVGARAGEGPVAWMRRVAATGNDATLRKIAQATGEPAEHIQTALGSARTLDDHRELRSQIRKSDEATRKGRAIPVPPGQAAPQTPRKPDGIAAALEKAKRAHGVDRDDGPVRADNVLEAKMHLAEGVPLERLTLSSTAKAQVQHRAERRNQAKADHARSLDGRIEQAAAHLERQGRNEEPEPEREERSGGMNIDDAIRAADAALGGNTHEDE